MIVTVFTKPGCGPCIATKTAMDARGIPFAIIDVTKEPAALKIVSDLGYRAMPVVIVGDIAAETIERHWGGSFRIDLINELAAEMEMQEGEG